jgi:hypothetical protein
MPFDTTLAAVAVQLEIFRRMTTEERLHLALEMSESLRNIALAGLRSRRPDLDADGLARELMRIMYGIVPPQ